MAQDNHSGLELSAVEQALAKSRARKAAKEAAVQASADATVATTENTSVEVATIVTASPEAAVLAEKAAKQAAKDALRAAKKVAKEAEKQEKRNKRAAKKAERASQKESKPMAHMSKVEKAAGKLPVMGEDARDTFNSATTNLGLTELNALAEHLKHFVRVQSTEKAVSVKLTVGQVVRIVNGPAKFIGCTATVVKPQRIRTYVEVPGYDKPVYLFTSDVVPLRTSDASELSPETVTEQATGTEG